MGKSNSNIKSFFTLAFVLVLLDQATKIAVKGFSTFGVEHQGMFLGESISVIGDFLRITYVENSGMAFGLEVGSFKIFLSLFSVAASIVLIYYLYKISKFSNFVKTGVALILAGAIGNLIDRVFYGFLYSEASLLYGRVVDFIQVDIPDVTVFGVHYDHWPVFNVADACVTVGVIILIIFHKKIPTLKEISGQENK